METKDRIRMIMESQHMTQQVFADFLHQSPATLSSIFNGRTRPTLNIVEAIKAKIPDISTEWLLFGSGEMYNTLPQASDQDENRPSAIPVEPTLNFETPVSPSPQPRVLDSSMHSLPHSVNSSHSDTVRGELKIVEKEPRKVTEIRVYYDDQTYETFVPAKK